ncbi:hypothetical protein L6164_010269 [Bauhinia variegata]|uniref:Uncharacterized protein n=1 Tax=Bauhinia variegata TaxID=167791 RepID=A0ACB9PLJ2_BAUVA|nr:hypothetical protein L6164_010269 [Bauhinia variegata]
MAGISGRLWEYRKRRGYRRLNGSGREKRSVQLGDGNTPRKRFWKIKIGPKIKILRKASPKKMLIWLRDAYVRMMMGLANSRAMSTAASSGYAGTLPGRFGSGRGPVKEYDEKMIIQIYRSLMMAQGQFLPRDAPRITPEILCRR